MSHESPDEYRSDNSSPHGDSKSSQNSGQPLPQPPGQYDRVQAPQAQQVQFSNPPPPYSQPPQPVGQAPAHSLEGQGYTQYTYTVPKSNVAAGTPPLNYQQQQQQPQYQPAPANSYANTANNGQPMPAPGQNIQYIYQPNVVGTQPPVYYPPPPPVNVVPVPGIHVGSEPWTTDLFDCMDDPNSALITMFLPCVTVGQVAEIVDSGTTTCTTAALIYGAIACLTGLQYAYSCGFRTKLRRMYNLVESPGPDILVHCLCGCCALSQEFRELRNRGLDPALGWNGALAARQQQLQLQQGGGGMAAPAPQMMAMR